MGQQIRREKIVEQLKTKNYKIEQNRECDCSVDRIDEGGIVISGNDCWRTSDLIVDGVTVYTDTQYDGVTDDYDISDELDDLGIAVSCGYGEMDVAHTDDEMQAMVIAYYEHRDDLRYYVHHPRGFANEYSVIIRPSADDPDEDWDEVSLDDWAGLATNSGDDATTMYIDFDITD